VRKFAPVLLAFLVACSNAGATGGPLEATGPMPELSGKTVQGGQLSPSDYDGKVVVVNLWASWCAPCRREQPMLQSTYERVQDQGVVFIGIDNRDDPAAARAHLEEFGVTYPSVPDPDGKLAYEFEFWGIPATAVAGRDGKLIYRKVGEISQAELNEMLRGAGIDV